MTTTAKQNTFYGLAAFTAFIFAIMIGLAAPASAETTKAEQFVQKLGEEALFTLEAADGNEDVIADKIKSWLNSYFDKDAIARFALGRHWRGASDAQKSEYQDVFEKMIVLTYSQRLAEYSGENFEVTGSTKVNSRDTIVHSDIIRTSKNAPKTRIDWRVRNGNKIVDVSVEGVSMSVTQRADFDAAIQKNGGNLDAFIAELKKKTS